MISVPIGYLHLADSLLDGDVSFPPEVSQNVRQRTAINRYYYALNRLGDYYLAEHCKDITYIASDKKHHTIGDRICEIGPNEALRIKSRMGQIYSKRSKADYENNYSSLATDADLVKRMAWQVKEIFDVLFEEKRPDSSG